MQLDREPFLEVAQDVCLILENSGKIVQVNKKAELFFNQDSLRLIGTRIETIFSFEIQPYFSTHPQQKKERDYHLVSVEYQGCWYKVVFLPYQTGYLLFIRQPMLPAQSSFSIDINSVTALLTKRALKNGGLGKSLEVLKNRISCDSVILTTFSFHSITIAEVCNLPDELLGKKIIGGCSEFIKKSLQVGTVCLCSPQQIFVKGEQKSVLKEYDFFSTLIVPFQSGTLTYGALIFSYHRPEQTFKTEQIVCACQLADLLGMLLYNKLCLGYRQNRQQSANRDIAVSGVINQGRISSDRRDFTNGELQNKVVYPPNGASQKIKFIDRNFYKAFYSNPCLMMLVDLDGRVQSVNHSFLYNTGFSKADICGARINEISLCSNGVIQLLQTRLWQEKQVIRQEIDFFTKAGELRQGFAGIELIRLNSKRLLLVQVEDVTDEKRLEQEMCRLDSLSIVGQMAAGISHEVRNPMTTVRGFLQMLMRKADCQKYKGFYELMILELDRANSLISEFLIVARNKPTNFSIQNLNDIVRAIEPLMYAQSLSLGKNLKISLGSIPLIRVNGKEIRQLLLNLVGNALDAMDKGQTVTVKTCLAEKTVQLIVIDQGAGIDKDILIKLGTPFFTTKEKGTGLGLPVCFQIAKQHGAVITVDSNAKGTAFTISFPLKMESLILPEN